MSMCLNCNGKIPISKNTNSARFCATCKNAYYKTRRSFHREEQFRLQPIDINVDKEIKYARIQKRLAR